MISFDPNTQISTLTIVGCGGTGAQVVRSVARMVYDMREARMHTPQVVLIDPDMVERPNVGRQLFTEADVGQPKAQVLMRRFNLALGLSMTAICEAVDAERHFERWGNLIVGCVDNHLARRELAKVNGALWCDSGNHANAGQVIIGNTGRLSSETRATATWCCASLMGVTAKSATCPMRDCSSPRCSNPKPSLRRSWDNPALSWSPHVLRNCSSTTGWPLRPPSTSTSCFTSSPFTPS